MPTVKRVRISSVHLSPDLAAKVDILAERENRSLVGEVATLVGEAVVARERRGKKMDAKRGR